MSLKWAKLKDNHFISYILNSIKNGKVSDILFKNFRSNVYNFQLVVVFFFYFLILFYFGL